MKTSADIRSDFLEFFRSKGHMVVPSASLVPSSDPTLMFTNSGMVPFKNAFLGSEKPPSARVVDVQRCLRAGGKHNDLDQVGYTARHHTFFEMLGNWSFGDYFKRDAILWAWELLTDVWKLPKDRLLVTVYQTDDEAYAIWKDQVGIPPERIVRIGDNKGAPFASDNFWQMADIGPCGPCTEIFYDHGAHIPGGPPGSPEEDGDRFIEIWNLVFMQFDRAFGFQEEFKTREDALAEFATAVKQGALVSPPTVEAQTDGSTKYLLKHYSQSPLPAPCVDTGMGLERLAAILQHVHTNYEIDLFQHLIKVAAQLTSTDDLENKSLRVIADHIRACAFLIVDGVLPSNEGRGYVLRRIIRRGLRHGWMLGVRGDFFWKMVEPLVAEMGAAYPELASKREFVERALKAEEERFGETLEQGMKVFEDVAGKSGSMIPGVDAFRLYDTYGFPVDLTADIARERGLTIDMSGFDKAMNEQRERARAASNFESKGQLPAEMASSLPPTVFSGYDSVEESGGRVLAMVRGGRRLESMADGEEGIVILDRTPFYAESGGQVGDAGELASGGGRFVVGDTIKLGGAFHGHVGRWQGPSAFVAGMVVSASVDMSRRKSIVLNHSATHLLHAALRKVLGEHVTQKGSLVAADRLRFDFSHFQPVTVDEQRRIEDLVNDEIRANSEAEIRQMGYDEAIEFGAMALFGEKYGDVVRVLRMGDLSTELCGGTHVTRTGDIGLFKILGEGGVASGIRRIEAVTGAAALRHVVDEEVRLGEIGHLLSAQGNEVVDKLRQLLDRQKKLERELDAFKAKAASAATTDLGAQAVDVGGIKVLAARVDGLDAKALRDSVDSLKPKLGDCVIVLAAGGDGKIALVGAVGGSALGRIKAGDVVAHVAAAIGGKGGGRPDMAQGGGNDTKELAISLAGLPVWVAGKLA